MARFTDIWFIRNNAGTYEAWQDNETSAAYSSANLVAGVLDNVLTDSTADVLILFDVGTFTLETTWNIDRSDITIQGAGVSAVTDPAIAESSTILNYTTATGDAMVWDRAAGTRLANIQLEGFHLKASSSTTSRGLILEGVAGVTLRDLSISGFAGGGIYSEGMWDSRLEYLRFDTCGTASGNAALRLLSSTDHGTFNATRLIDCTIESSPGPDLEIDDLNTGGRPNKINIRGCKFESLGTISDDRLQITDADYFTMDGCNVFTGNLVSGGPHDQIALTDTVDVHIRGCRFESTGTTVTLDSFIKCSGNNGLSLESLYFQSGDELIPDTACVVWTGTNDRVALGALDVVWAGGDAQANVAVHSGAPSTYARTTFAHHAVTEVSAATTLTALESPGVINVDTSGGAVTVTLPDNAEADGRSYIIRRDGGSAVTINRAGTDTIGSGAATSLSLDTDGAAVGLISVGDANWKQVSTEGTVT